MNVLAAWCVAAAGAWPGPQVVDVQRVDARLAVDAARLQVTGTVRFTFSVLHGGVRQLRLGGHVDVTGATVDGATVRAQRVADAWNVELPAGAAERVLEVRYSASPRRAMRWSSGGALVARVERDGRGALDWIPVLQVDGDEAEWRVNVDAHATVGVFHVPRFTRDFTLLVGTWRRVEVDRNTSLLVEPGAWPAEGAWAAMAARLVQPIRDLTGVTAPLSIVMATVPQLRGAAGVLDGLVDASPSAPGPDAWALARALAGVCVGGGADEARAALVDAVALRAVEEVVGALNARAEWWSAAPSDEARQLLMLRGLVGEDAFRGLVVSSVREPRAALDDVARRVTGHGIPRVMPESPLEVKAAGPWGVSVERAGPWSFLAWQSGERRGAVLGASNAMLPESPWALLDPDAWSFATSPNLGTLSRAAANADDEGTRARALGALGKDPADRAILLRAVDDPAALVREHALRWAAVHPGLVDVAPLQARLSDPSPRVRAAAARALHGRADAEGTRVLGRLTGGDPSSDVRLAAAQALGTHAVSAAELVERALKLGTPDASVEGEVLRGVCAVTPDHASIIRAAERGRDEEFVAAARCVALESKRASVLRAAWARLASHDRRVRMAALAVMDRYRAREARESLRAMLADEPDERVASRMESLVAAWR